MQRSSLPESGINLSLVVGVLRQAPVVRTGADGEAVLSFDLAVRVPDLPLESVPVVWSAAPSAAATWASGLEVLVIGRVRRRFFRAGGSTQSRTEVLATSVIPTRRRVAARRALEQVRQAIDPLGSP
ncbi:MAG: hypothetical protein ACT4OV_01620 [Microthrixaceae bacterium]